MEHTAWRGRLMELLGDRRLGPEAVDGPRLLQPADHCGAGERQVVGLVDLFRKHVPDPGQYTYYDYRTVNGVAEGKGWRVDHILTTQPLAERSISAWIDLGPRQREKPSDHTPLVVEFKT